MSKLHYDIGDIQDVYDNAIRSGAAKERERIIALLEGEIAAQDASGGLTYIRYATEILELIKGENA